MDEDSNCRWKNEDALLVATGQMKPASKEMDWQDFWQLPGPEVSEEAVRESVAWSKSGAVDRLIDRWIVEGSLRTR